MNKVVLDTNAIIRYLTKDDPTKAEEVRRFLEEAEKVIITTATLIETVYVLKSERINYGWKRKQIADALIDLLALGNVESDPIALPACFLWKEDRRIDDIEDAINCLTAQKKGATLWTYDKRLKKVCLDLKVSTQKG